MLIERRIPVTYFVTTFHTTEQQPFQHDREANAPLPTNTIESLRALDIAGIEIGGHSRTHVDLGKITSEQTLVDEVIAASAEMGELIGRPVRYFAFPYGQHANLNPVVFTMLKEAGFLGVCSAYQGWNEIGGDDFHLQRIHGDPNFSRLKNWLSFDPRMAAIERYDYLSQIGEAKIPQVKSDATAIAVAPSAHPSAGLPQTSQHPAT
jgi:peptidoglycan/xylan/chitin deacetylase (PgdA/CDA1 family)